MVVQLHILRKKEGLQKKDIWLLSIDTFLTYLYDIIDTVPYFDYNKISLCDLSMDNIRLGIKKAINHCIIKEKTS